MYITNTKQLQYTQLDQRNCIMSTTQSTQSYTAELLLKQLPHIKFLHKRD